MPPAQDLAKKLPESSIAHWRLVLDSSSIYGAVLQHNYPGSGTIEDPYVVEWLTGDVRNPLNWSLRRKVTYTLILAISSLSVAFSGSAYQSGAPQIEQEFDVDVVIVTLGIFLFNIGQATGPVLWGPLSELYGRQLVFIVSFFGVTLFNGACTASQSIAALLVMRLFTGICASSPLTNAGGAIGDMFPQSQRGLAMSAFIVSPYLGPAIGPIVSGFVAETVGWRWVEGIMTLFTGSMFLLGAATLPETYAPFLLQRRAQRLSRMTGATYRDSITIEKGQTSPGKLFKTALSRPWLLLFYEPTITLLSIYMAIIYGTLYSFFSAFPIVYEETRGWTQGIGGLAFIGVAIGMIFGVIGAVFVNIQYKKIIARGQAVPEKRLIPAMVGSILLPGSLMWFAWTNYPSISAIASIAAGVPFAMGMVLTYLAITNYLVDSYSVFAASALAANAVLRCLFGAAFPMFTPAQYNTLGIHWGAALMGFLSLACTPFPWLFSRYGARIRKHCRYAAEAARLREMISEKEKVKEEVETAPEGKAEKIKGAEERTNGLEDKTDGPDEKNSDQ